VSDEVVLQTKWRQSARTRLRRCLPCNCLFPSTGSDERICHKCARRAEDARIRAYTETDGRDILNELEDWFDLDRVTRENRSKAIDDEDRTRRQGKILKKNI
jgi:hypothetical protein